MRSNPRREPTSAHRDAQPGREGRPKGKFMRGLTLFDQICCEAAALYCVMFAGGRGPMMPENEGWKGVSYITSANFRPF